MVGLTGGLAVLTKLTALDICSGHISSSEGFAADIQRLPLRRLHLHGEFPRPTSGWQFLRNLTTLTALHMWHSKVVMLHQPAQTRSESMFCFA